MTSWPWMVGIDVAALAEPIAPVNSSDARPAVRDLIAQHRSSIDEVKAAIENNALFDSDKHDDLWILRFVLSHIPTTTTTKKQKKPIKDAIRAARFTLQFRDEHGLDTKDVRYHPVGPEAQSDEVRRYMSHCTDDALRFTLPDPKRGVVAFLNFAGIRQHDLAKHLDPKDWLPTFLYIAEWTHQWLDYVTRTTGRLTKSVRMVDFQEAQLNSINHEANKRDGAAMNIMEDIYPQLLQTLFICHGPVWIQIPWRILRPLLPKRLVAKMDFINPDKNRNERKRLFEHVDEDHLPVRFGGKYELWPVAFPLPPP